MTEDETFTFPRISLAWIALISAAFSGVFWFVDGWRESYPVLGVSIVFFFVYWLYYRKPTKSVTLKTDALHLEGCEIRYQDIVQVRFSGRRYGTVIYVITRNNRINLPLGDLYGFMDSLAARMEAKGIRIEKKKELLWDEIREIINLDLQKKH